MDSVPDPCPVNLFQVAVTGGGVVGNVMDREDPLLDETAFGVSGDAAKASDWLSSFSSSVATIRSFESAVVGTGEQALL